MKRPARAAARLGRYALSGLALAAVLGGAHAWSAALNGSATALGAVTNVQQSGAPPAATITVTPAGGGSAFVITPNASRTIIDWNSFSLASGSSLTFALGARNDIAVNRVASGAASIDGVLSSTVAGAYGGNVWFIAPGGVAFGSGAVVNVGGLLATPSALSMSDSAFLSSGDTTTFTFGGAATGASVSVASGASLTAHGGLLALVAPVVSAEAGAAVGADAGGSQTLYAAAKAYRVTFAPDASNDLDLVSFLIDAPSDSATPLALAGTTTAGNIYVAGAASVVNALISAPGAMVATTASSQGGAIVLSAGGLATSGGAVVATAPDASTASAMTTTTLGPLTASAATLNASGALAFGGAVSSSSLDIEATGAVTQTAPISASLLTGSAGSLALTHVGNAISTISGFSAGAGFSLNDAATTGLTVASGAALGGGSGGVSLSNAGPLTMAGHLTSTGGQASLNAADGDLVLTGVINAAGQTLTLEASGAIVQRGRAGSIATALLTGTSGGETRLGLNNTGISALGDFSAGAGFRLNDTAPTGLTIVSGATISAGTGQLSLSSAGGLTVAGTLVSTGGQASLTTTGGGDITLAGGVNAAGQTLILNASGAVSQTGGGIAAALLSGASAGPTSLNGSGNAVAAIGGYSAGSGFALRDATVGLTLASGATLDGGTGGVSLGNTGAVIIAGTLNSPHGPASLTAATPLGDIDLSGVINAPNQTLVLTASGGVAQTGGSITTALLTGSSTGATSLTQGVNAVTAIGDYHAGAGFALTGAGSLIVSGTLTSTNASTALTTTSGDIVLAGAVNAAGQTLSLNAPGAISQTGGSVSANLLTGASGGATTFVQAGNTVSTIGDFSAGAGFSLSDAAAGGLTLGAGHTLQGGAGGVTLSNAGPLTIAGALTSTGGPASLTAGLGDLVLTGSVNAAGQT